MHVSEYHWKAGGWVIRTRRAPILKNHKQSVSDDSHNAWRRELGLTRFAGQELPEYTYGGNSLELRHTASGVRLSFCALEAFRAWSLLEAEVCAALPRRSREYLF